MQHILRGLYNIEWTKRDGRQLLSKLNCTNTTSKSNRHGCTKQSLAEDSGSPDEWRNIPIDTKLVPFLTENKLSDCRYRKEHPSQIDANLTIDPQIKSLIGVQFLKDTLKKKYDQELTYSCCSLWSTIAAEMNLMRTQSTINYTDHYSDWVNLPVVSKAGSTITLFDLFEEVVVLTYLNRVVDEANYIQTGPIITSLIESQMIALGHNSTSERMQKYKDKKMVIYTSHDSILQKLLFSLGLFNFETPFEQRFFKWDKIDDDVGKFLDGLKMPSFGLSARFELYEAELEGKKNKFPYVQLSLYNQEEAKFRPIEYKHIDFGSACRHLFKKKYPKAKDLSRFYDPDFQIDLKHSCPFELLRNLTSNLIIDDKKFSQLCD